MDPQLLQQTRAGVVDGQRRELPLLVDEDLGGRAKMLTHSPPTAEMKQKI